MAGLISLRPVAVRLFAACLVIFVSVGAMSVFLACSRVCPQAVYPGKHIQLLRNALSDGQA